MRKRLFLLLSGLIVAAQVVNPLPHGTTAVADAQRSASTNGKQAAETIYTAAAVQTKTVQPNFDIEVLAPLQAKQAAEKAAAEAAAQAAAQAAQLAAKAKAAAATPVHAAVASGDAFARLAQCEAGGNYATNTGNGYFGAYQYNIGTWSNYGGYARPDLAPPAVQDAKARETQAARGWSPWPACARKLGLM